jgi:hypothetical protein
MNMRIRSSKFTNVLVWKGRNGKSETTAAEAEEMCGGGLEPTHLAIPENACSIKSRKLKVRNMGGRYVRGGDDVAGSSTCVGVSQQGRYRTAHLHGFSLKLDPAV